MLVLLDKKENDDEMQKIDIEMQKRLDSLFDKLQKTEL
jgi:hypothetical protein